MVILGHPQFSTTMDHYGHIMTSAHREAAAGIDTILRPAAATEDEAA